MTIESDLIRRYRGAVSPDECDEIISHIEHLNSNSFMAYDKSSLHKQDHISLNLSQDWTVDLPTTSRLSELIIPRFQPCVEEYLSAFSVLNECKFLAYDMKLKKIPVGGGFHAWHFENGGIKYSQRVFVCQLYLNDDFDELKIGTTGKFGGLGIEITTEDGFVKVISPIDDTPAQRAGIEAGDLIIKVGNESLKDMDIGDAVKLMRGEPGTEVEITVLRKKVNEPIVFDITREIIISKGIKTKIFNDDIAYLRLSSFQSNSTNDLKSAIYKLRKNSSKEIKAIILDLRNNPGGVLGSAVGITDLFLKEGKIVYTKGRTINSKLEYSATAQDISNGLPLIVMINEGSASASEIVAGALQDHKRAKIVGTKSYGKASVQTIQELSDGSALKLTTARYYTPFGRDIHTEGIKPDIEIERKRDEVVSLPEPYETDNQLFETIKIASDMMAAEL